MEEQRKDALRNPCPMCGTSMQKKGERWQCPFCNMSLCFGCEPENHQKSEDE